MVVSEWIIAVATVAMVVIAVAGLTWTHRTLNELKTSRKAEALPVLQFGVGINGQEMFFVIKNIGNGLARDITLKVEFEGYDHKTINSKNVNIPSGGQMNLPLSINSTYYSEHGSTITMKIHSEFEDIYGETFETSTVQSMNQLTIPLK